MPFTVPAVPQDEPDAAVPAGAIGEAAEILALVSRAARRRAGSRHGGRPVPGPPGRRPAARPGLAMRRPAGPLATRLEAALAVEGIACDRVLPRYWRRPS